MITLYTIPVPAQDLREAYTSLRAGGLIYAIKAVRTTTPMGLKQAKDLCEAMRDGHTAGDMGTFFISPQTLQEVKGLSAVRPREAAVKLAIETAGLMMEGQAETIVKDLLDPTRAGDSKVQVKPWPVAQQSATASVTPSSGTVAGKAADDVSSAPPLTTTPGWPNTTAQAGVLKVRPKPAPSEPGTARRTLADELKLAWRRAGEPPLRKLRRQLLGKGLDCAVSIASISKAMSGSTGRPPSWTLVAGLLEQFDSGADIDGFWRPLWAKAREEVAPLGLTSATDTTKPSTITPVISLVSTSGQDNTTGEPDDRAPETGNTAPAGFECEDCGSWVVNADRHYAWHWNMEKQLRRTIIRGIESTGS
ncbi:hypothetical protein [Nonomuraea sp. NPDC003709]|uniref:hypothetical protein n=1 Tax=Nonomuraea sp. NPDC003709 TaxID=3154450 RepID=UPI0033BA280C